MSIVFSILFVCISSSIFAEHFLTFIIPCYNCAPWIEQAVESIYQQKNLKCPFEIVCTDDGSTDATYSVLVNLCQRHPEMRIFQHEKNRGGSFARNTCVRNSLGDIIFNLDADNVLFPDSVQSLIDQMDRTGDDVVAFGGIQYFVGNFHRSGSVVYNTFEHKYFLKDIVQDANTPPWSGNYLYTKESWQRCGGYPEQYSTIDTYAFGFKQIISGCKLSYVPGTTYWHRTEVNGYYIRELRSRRLPIHFFELILAHDKLFKEDAIHTIRDNLHAAKEGRAYFDQVYCMDSKMIQLR